MKVLFKSSKNQTISHKDILDIFEQEVESVPPKPITEGNEETEEVEVEEEILKNHLPQLDVHQLLSLKIAYNLKELTYSKNVKKFFFSRFKRRLIK
jgi:hypothetical protein